MTNNLIKSYFTAEEVAEAIRHFDIEAFVVGDDPHLSFESVQGNIDELSFSMWFSDPEPFHEEGLLVAIKSIKGNPIEWSLNWNSEYRWTTGAPSLDEHGALNTASDGSFIISIRRKLSFRGGITHDALASTVGWFVKDFMDFHEIEDGEDEGQLTESTGEQQEIPLADALVTELQVHGPQSARQLAAATGTPKSEVNSQLYGRPDLFIRKHGSPPMWYPNPHD
jgi:hypothetical protein